MLGIAATLLTWLLGLFIKRPSQEAQAAARAATAETKLAVEVNNDAQVAKAAAAANAVDSALVRDPGKLRDPDRYSRD
jgi:hypothetical protein